MMPKQKWCRLISILKQFQSLIRNSLPFIELHYDKQKYNTNIALLFIIKAFLQNQEKT